MRVWRCSLMGLVTICLGMALGASVWSNPVRLTLSDVELQQLWGGSPELLCDSRNVPDCTGYNSICADYFGGNYEGANCIGPTHVWRHFNPEACGSQGDFGSPSCQNPMNLNVACKARVRCATILYNGQYYCDEISAMTTWVTISTDPNKCRNLIPNPLQFPMP